MKIGLPGILTIIFVVLKLIGTISWSWWWVFSPSLISLGIWALLWLFVGAFFVKAAR